VIAVTIIANGRKHGRPDPEAGKAGPDIPGEPADSPGERSSGSERRPRRARGEVDADATDDEGFDLGAPPMVTLGT